MKSRYAILILVFLLMLSCSNTKNTKGGAATTETTNVDSPDNYKLIVSFYSPGNGIDHKTKQKYVEFITNNYPKVVYEKTKWGREGEIDFCFQLNELKENQKEQFVKESKELLSVSSRVHVYENAPCRNKKKL